jgi:hypothetical protein
MNQQSYFTQISFRADIGRVFSAFLKDERPVIDLLQLYTWRIKIAEGNNYRRTELVKKQESSRVNKLRNLKPGLIV